MQRLNSKVVISLSSLLFALSRPAEFIEITFQQQVQKS